MVAGAAKAMTDGLLYAAQEGLGHLAQASEQAKLVTGLLYVKNSIAAAFLPAAGNIAVFDANGRMVDGQRQLGIGLRESRSAMQIYWLAGTLPARLTNEIKRNILLVAQQP